MILLPPSLLPRLASIQPPRRLESRLERSLTFMLLHSRPPGHHAAPSLCGGYCYLNNVAIAAKWYQQQAAPSPESTAEGKPRVAILDIDYHHGNGEVLIYSLHQPRPSSDSLYTCRHVQGLLLGPEYLLRLASRKPRLSLSVHKKISL